MMLETDYINYVNYRREILIVECSEDVGVSDSERKNSGGRSSEGPTARTGQHNGEIPDGHRQIGRGATSNTHIQSLA